MEQDSTSLSWSDITAPGEDELLTNFLEYGMPFPDLEGHGPTDHLPARSLSHQVSISTSAAPTQEQLACMDPENITAESASYTQIMNDFSVDLPGHSQQGVPTSSYSSAPMTPAYFTQKPQVFHNVQQSQPPQQSPAQNIPHTTQPYIPHGQMMIPPTPNSIELQGHAAPYPQRVDQTHEMYDCYPRMNDEQALYTPLVSPAMTPLENQFRAPEYTRPGEYFTPLTSPAIEAQNANANGYPMHSTQLSDMGFIHSPIDHAIPTSSAPSSPGVARKHRRRPSTTTKLQSRLKKQQSPSVRPQTRTRSRMTEDALNNVTQDQSMARPINGSGLRYGSNESSGQDSVSPEPLSEPLMPPPALPPSRKSPAIAPQMNHTNAAPATPAMLMRMQRSPHSQPTSNGATPNQLAMPEPHDDIMEDVVLPEAITPSAQLFRPQMARIDTTITTAPSPIIPANITSHPDPKSAPPSEKHPSSIAPSPRSVPMASPSGPVGKKSDTPKLGPMNSRKRQSLSSSHPSPSLRPKISPNIQPSVRGDAMAGDASALYLASKSNYQHILDGTLLPGVSYPDTLAENLSSKRTNHKLAEQGRRNRINNALKEIEALIPPAFVQVKSSKEAASCNGKGTDKEKEKVANQPISKASTVEMAIDYIKSLQKELEFTRTKLVAAEAKLTDHSCTTLLNGEAKAVETNEVAKARFEETVTPDSENNHAKASTAQT